jgi:hypothetical protein
MRALTDGEITEVVHLENLARGVTEPTTLAEKQASENDAAATRTLIGRPSSAADLMRRARTVSLTIRGEHARSAFLAGVEALAAERLCRVHLSRDADGEHPDLALWRKFKDAFTRAAPHTGAGSRFAGVVSYCSHLSGDVLNALAIRRAAGVLAERIGDPKARARFIEEAEALALACP